MDQQHPGQDDDSTVTAKELSSCDYTDQVSILVGPAEKPFTVHKDIICAKSKFFRAACSKCWLPGKEKKVRLPDVDPEIFQKYVSWVYCGQLDLSSLSNEAIDGLDDERDRNVARYLELYFLGDTLDDVRLRNKTMQNLVNKTTTLPRPSTAKRVWEKTPENSPLRRMIVDRATLRTNRGYLTGETLTKYPESFVVQAAVSLFQKVPTKDKESFEGNLSSYAEPRRRVSTDRLVWPRCKE